MPGKIRSTKQRRRILDPFKTLFGSRSSLPVRTGPRRGTALPQQSPFPEPPEGWPGTLPEWAVYWANLQKGLIPGQDFTYLQDGPDTAEVQVDFFYPQTRLGLQVQGEFFHNEFHGRPRARDDQQRALLESIGVTVVWLDEEDVLRDPVFYLTQALNGIDLSQRGMFGR